MTREKARKLRALIVKASAALEDPEALEGMELFPLWSTSAEYPIGCRVRYGDSLYRCEQAHTSQAGWEPDHTPALWTELSRPGEIPVWRQPTGAQDAYKKGDLVHFPDMDSSVWISLTDNNTWKPGVYGWSIVD